MSMNRSDFNKILRQYDERKSMNTRAHHQRLDQVYNRIPRLDALNKQVSSISMESIQKTLQDPSNREKYESQLKEKIARISQEKKKLLEENGYPANYLDPIYSCQDCQDTGYINNKKCHCLQQAIIDFAYEQSNLKDVLSLENFTTFRFDYYSHEKDPKTGISPLENMQSVHQICKEFVRSFDQSFKNLILYGQSGLGKTFLCNSIAKELLDEGKTVIYLSAFQLFRLFENYRFHKEEEAVHYSDIESIYTCDLLIIDDLGTEFSNSLTSAELFNALNSRLLNRKSTVISTNLGPNEWVNQYSERIISRIFGYYTQLKLFGSDVRLMRYR